MRAFHILLLAISASSAPAFAQSDGDHHDDSEYGEIVVTGVYRREGVDVLGGVSIIKDDELTRDLRPTIGETLARQPGVSASSFGPAVSRPILRGFQGERVRILSDGIGSFDVSNTSADHAVAINPLTADRIEVLRGPASLMFGSSAIGGVVNVIDSRIPRRIGNENFHFDSIATYGSAGNERTANGRIDIPLSATLIAHADASFSKTGDLHIPGFVLTPQLRARALASGDPAIAPVAALSKRLPNSSSRLWEVAGGLAWIGNSANLGASVTRYNNLYGIPVRFATRAGEGAEAVRLDARQTRYDLRGEIEPASSFIEEVRLRAGYANYDHAELDAKGSIGTRFFSKGVEARLEIIQQNRGGWTGAFGAQFFDRKLSILGDEKFLPPSRSGQLGLFTLQSLERGTLRAEAGARVEFARAQAKADAQLGTPALTRSFTSASGSLGATWEFSDRWKIGLIGSLNARAPSAEELFPNGPHAGTQTFEIGDPGFRIERSKGLEMNLRGSGDGFSFGASLFKSWFSNFIYDLPTGAIEDGLPVFQFAQDRARYWGAELEVEARLAELRHMTISADLVADMTRATIKGTLRDFAAPRIPPVRLSAGLSAKNAWIDLRAEVEWTKRQTRIAPVETATGGFTLFNTSATVRPWGTNRDINLTLSGNNLFNVEARRHSSLLKDYAPLSGRDIRVTLRIGF